MSSCNAEKPACNEEETCAEEKPACQRATAEVLVMIVFDRCLTRSFYNSVVREKSVINNYGNGDFLGFAEEVECIEGNWPSKLTIGLLRFDTFDEGHRWFESDPLFRQHDWLDQVDMFMIPLSLPFPKKGYPVMALMNVHAVCNPDFMAQYGPPVGEAIKKYGGVAGIAGTNEVQRWRGRRDMRMVSIASWPSLDAFHCWYNSEEYKDPKELRHQSLTGDLIVCQLQMCN